MADGDSGVDGRKDASHIMNMKKVLLINILTLVVLIGGGAIGYYYYDQATSYVKTENAKIDGKMITIASPGAGKLTDWTAKTGQTLDSDATLGHVMMAQAGQKPVSTSIVMPTKATVVQSMATENGVVGAGTPLAYGFNLNNLWVTANIEETDIDEVKVGQTVDVYVDSYPDTTLSGEVEQIGMTTAGTFSMMPSSNGNANYTKVAQVIPVKVSLSQEKLLDIRPGMNVTVRIHKD